MGAVETSSPSVAEIARLFSTGEFSPVALLDACLARIEEFDDDLHAFTYLDVEAAYRMARRAEGEIRAGAPPSPLRGVPVAVKDVVDVAGYPTSYNSKSSRRPVPRCDASVVGKLRAAGAVLLGKTNTYEFALGGPVVDSPFPSARNPWNIEHHPGGSSSGSAVGIAAGFFPLAVGTDTAGSIRHPAAACGVVGLKPTYGSLPVDGVFPASPTLDHVGPMARSVGDVGALFDLLMGGPRNGSGYLGRLSNDVGRLKIGYVRHLHADDVPAHPEVARALDRAATILKSAGAEVLDVRLPALERFSDALFPILYSEAWSVHERAFKVNPDKYNVKTREMLLKGASLSVDDYIVAKHQRSRLAAEVDYVFDDVDILLCANSMDPPTRFDDEDAMARTYWRQARVPFNVTGHPAIAVPSELASDGLPMSVQLVGRRFEEATLLEVAQRYEHLRGDLVLPS